MTTTEVWEQPGSLTKVFPAVYVGTALRPLADAVQRRIHSVVVDSHLRLPDMFEITFYDRDSDISGLSALAIGTPVVISAHTAKDTAAARLITGEVTSLQSVFAEFNSTVVRGYSAEHRLQRVRRTRTFLNMKDSDIVSKIVSDAGLQVGDIDQTKIAHEHVGQVNQTDWEFLAWRAAMIGFDFGLLDGKFFFRDSAGATGSVSTTLTFPRNLRMFAPRVTAGNLPAQAEVRLWDPLQAKAVSSAAPMASNGTELSGAAPDSLAGVFAPKPAAAQQDSTNPAVGDLGPNPRQDAFVVSDWPLAAGTSAASVSAEVAGGIAGHLAGTFAEAEGEALGDPRLAAGTQVQVVGVADMFAGTWLVTRARHAFDEAGYRTSFEVGGRDERTLLGLTRAGAGHGGPVIGGLVCGIVSNNKDPQTKGRVKVTLAWLSPQFESDWAPVVQAGAGQRSGGVFLPEVGDQVLVGFEFGNPNRPYVLGGVLSNASAYTLGGEPIKASGESTSVVWRGLVSPSGNRLAFHDEVPPGEGASATASDLVLGTKSGSMALVIDQTAGTVLIKCEPASPDSNATEGTLTIQCGPKGTIDLKTGAGGTVNIDGGGQLNLTATTAIKIESNGQVEIKGNPIKLN